MALGFDEMRGTDGQVPLRPRSGDAASAAGFNEQSKDTLRLAGRLDAERQCGRIDEILTAGPHAYLTLSLERVNSLGAGNGRDLLVPMRP